MERSGATPNGRYAIDYDKMPGALADLAKELLEIEATGDRDRAENWFKKYGQMPDELKTALKAASDVPVDIDPVFEFAEKGEVAAIRGTAVQLGSAA